jgi:hypothetical protein
MAMLFKVSISIPSLQLKKRMKQVVDTRLNHYDHILRTAPNLSVESRLKGLWLWRILHEGGRCQQICCALSYHFESVEYLCRNGT